MPPPPINEERLGLHDASRPKSDIGWDLLYFGGAIVLGGAAYSLGSKHFDKVKLTANTTWNAAKATPRFVWNATKWTVSNGFAICKYIIVNIPAAIKWTGLTIWASVKWIAGAAWSCAKWAFSCIRHPITAIQNAFNNAVFGVKWPFEKTKMVLETYVLPPMETFMDYSIKVAKDFYASGASHVQKMARDLNAAYPITGRIAAKVYGHAAVAFGFVSSKVTTVAQKALPFNPMPWVFEKAPSLMNPAYAALAAAGSSLASDIIASKLATHEQVSKKVASIKAGFSTRAHRKALKKVEASIRKVDDSIRMKADVLFMLIGTVYFAPRLANYFSKHQITPLQSFGWGVAFFGTKQVLNLTGDDGKKLKTLVSDALIRLGKQALRRIGIGGKRRGPYKAKVLSFGRPMHGGS